MPFKIRSILTASFAIGSLACNSECRGGHRRSEQSARCCRVSESLFLRSLLLFSLESLLSLLNLRPSGARQLCYLPTEPCDDTHRVQN